jgi:hypothetical protein
MNERFEKLKNMAVDHAQEVFEYHGKDYREIVMEKFAELIVQECIEVFSKDMPDPTSPDYKLGSLNEVVDRVCNVAEHFGVKE